MNLEKMEEFFTKRVDEYEEHMLNQVAGCKEGYLRMSELVPDRAEKLLDLGCGTGLELEAIFKKLPYLQVTGVDLTAAMLAKLKDKYIGKNLTLINASYFDYNFGKGTYDVVISFQTLHHFSHEEKLRLYKKIYDALISGGKYIECDYMVTTQKEEDYYFRENERLRCMNQIPEGEFYHYDTPCTIQNQIKLFYKAGFTTVNQDWRMENTTILVAEK